METAIVLQKRVEKWEVTSVRSILANIRKS
jgi:hypothetical protein